MSHCILILGPPRSGTSATAGILHMLGVDMGLRLMPADEWNQKGHYSDLDFEAAFHKLGLLDAHKGMNFWGADPVPQDFMEMVASKKGKVWGLKHYLTPFAFKALKTALDESGQGLRVVRTTRSLYESVQSLMARTGGNEAMAANFITGHEYAVQKVIHEFGLDPIVVDFDNLLKNPSEMVRALAWELNVTDKGKIADAVAFIEPALRRVEVR